jgi:hypothetical protein
VHMRVQPEITVGALDDRDRAALAVGQAAVSLALAVPRRNRIHEDAQHLAQEFAVKR